MCWFGKLPPYNIDEFYYLSADDKQRFGIHGVTVLGKPPVSIEGAIVRPVTVDWNTLDAIRPVLATP